MVHAILGSAGSWSAAQYPLVVERFCMAIRAVKHDAAIAVGATRMARVKLPTVTAPAAADCNTKVRLTMSLLWNSPGLREKINIVLA